MQCRQTALVPTVFDASILDGSAVTRCLKDGSFCSYLPAVCEPKHLKLTLSNCLGALTALGVVPLSGTALTSAPQLQPSTAE